MEYKDTRCTIFNDKGRYYIFECDFSRVLTAENKILFSFDNIRYHGIIVDEKFIQENGFKNIDNFIQLLCKEFYEIYKFDNNLSGQLKRTEHFLF